MSPDNIARPRHTETTMATRRLVASADAAAFTLSAAAALNACGGSDDSTAADPKGQASLEVYAELTQSGIAAITQMPSGQLIIGYHPFYLTPTSVQVATLNT